MTVGLLALAAGWWLAQIGGASEARAAAPAWIQYTRTWEAPSAPGIAVTPTPFLPVGPTPTLSPTPTPRPTSTPVIDPYIWYGLDLHDSAQTITLRVDAPVDVNGGREITLAFRPGVPCEYRDHRACVSAHFAGKLLLATVHSGVGGEGQALRHAVEGTGLNRAGFPLERIQDNLAGLRGARLSVSASKEQVDNLRVLAALRIPPAGLAEYFTQPVEAAFESLAADSPALRAALERGKPLLAVETCGWRHPAEPWAEGVSDTTGSVYIIVVGKQQ